MTEFTSEFISNWRNAIKVVTGVRGEMREVEKFALEALDEIERLRKVIDLRDDAIESYATLYDKATALFGYTDVLPSEEMNELILERLGRKDGE